MISIDHVTISRRIDVPAAMIFALLADPARHAELDGSGMVRDPVTPTVVSTVGQVFAMRMHNDFLGDYVIDNHVVELDPDRRIVWEPVLAATTREEAKANVGRNLGHRWGYELVPDGPASTTVSETFDCSRSAGAWQDDLQDHMRTWIPQAIATSLDTLGRLTAGG